jgi:hypothetical protein
MPEKPKLEVVTASPNDASDLSDLWLDPALGDSLTEMAWHSVPVGKPKDFFRVNPDPSSRRLTEVYTHKPEGQIEEQHFILAASMRGRIEEARPATIVSCVYRDGSPRLWVLKAPKQGEKMNDAWKSARSHARTAMKQWGRLVWVRNAYVWKAALPGYAPDPDWSRVPSFDQLVLLAFGPHGIIRDERHPIYRELMGDASAQPADDDGTDL